jgi:hypothetical protein
LLQGLEQSFTLDAELHGGLPYDLLFFLLKRSVVAVVVLVENREQSILFSLINGLSDFVAVQRLPVRRCTTCG